jgi:hypothetical protein
MVLRIVGMAISLLSYSSTAHSSTQPKWFHAILPTFAREVGVTEFVAKLSRNMDAAPISLLHSAIGS